VPVNVDALVIHVLVSTVILSPVFWLAGRALVGKDKAKFTDAVLIVVVGTVVGAMFGAFFTGFVAAIIQFILWLLIVRHFFDCGWLKALAISIVAIVILIVIVVALAFVGFTLIRFIL